LGPEQKVPPCDSRDGGVHQLWVVTGIKTDPTLTNCSLTQPDFVGQFQAGNLSFRIPLQMLGLGLIESIQDREILGRSNATVGQRAALGISALPHTPAAGVASGQSCPQGRAEVHFSAATIMPSAGIS
jgi:hypothetical protein